MFLWEGGNRLCVCVFSTGNRQSLFILCFVKSNNNSWLYRNLRLRQLIQLIRDIFILWLFWSFFFSFTKSCEVKISYQRLDVARRLWRSENRLLDTSSRKKFTKLFLFIFFINFIIVVSFFVYKTAKKNVLKNVNWYPHVCTCCLGINLFHFLLFFFIMHGLVHVVN